jgi:hypothetical protein
MLKASTSPRMGCLSITNKKEAYNANKDVT